MRMILRVLVILVLCSGCLSSFAAQELLTFVWTGTAGDGNFNTAANWSGNAIPTTNSIVSFDDTGVYPSNKTLNNNLPAGTALAFRVFLDGLTLTGNSVQHIPDSITTLTRFRIAPNGLAPISCTFAFPMVVAANEIISADFGVGSSATFSGAISGDGGFVIFLRENVTATLSGANSFTGQFTAAKDSGLSDTSKSGQVILANPDALKGCQTVVVDQARLNLQANITTGKLVANASALDPKLIQPEIVLNDKSLISTSTLLQQPQLAKIISTGGTLQLGAAAGKSIIVPYEFSGPCTLVIASGFGSCLSVQAPQTSVEVRSGAELVIVQRQPTLPAPPALDTPTVFGSITVRTGGMLTSANGASGVLMQFAGILQCGDITLESGSTLAVAIDKGVSSQISCNNLIISGAILKTRGFEVPTTSVAFVNFLTLTGAFSNALDGGSIDLEGSGGKTVKIDYNGTGPGQLMVNVGKDAPKKKPSTTEVIQTGPVYLTAKGGGTEPLPLLAKVQPVGKTPDVSGGTVTFNVGGPQIPPGVVPSSGVAAVKTVQKFAVGTYAVTALYSGNAFFDGSASTNNISVTVQKWPTAIRFRRDTSLIQATAPFTIKTDVRVTNFPVSADPGSPTGTVALIAKAADGSEVQVVGGPVNPIGTGITSEFRASTPVLAAGSYELRVDYSGDAIHAQSLGKLKFTINADGTVFTPDDDGDGIPNQVESLAGGQSGFVLPESTTELKLKTGALKLALNPPTPASKDSISFSGEIVGVGELTDNTFLIVTLGENGITKSFTLTAKGKPQVKSDDTFTLGKPKNGVSKFSVKFNKGNFAADLLPIGFPTSKVDAKAVRQAVLFGVYLNIGAFQAQPTVEYTITKEKLTGKLAKVQP